MSSGPSNLIHYMCPAVHLVTGETFTSYKKAMKDLVIADVWQTAFGREFGGMAQGDDKTKTKGTNAMFVMSHDDIARLRGTKYTYTNIVLDHRPQKEDPNRIRITAGGNLIQYNDELSVRTADISTAKLHWNSVNSTPDARYMCLDLSLFYLLAALEYYEYMKIPLALFPKWIVEQYDLFRHAKDGMVHIEMRRAGGDYRKRVYLQIKNYVGSSHHAVITNATIRQDCGTMRRGRYRSRWWYTILALNTLERIMQTT